MHHPPFALGLPLDWTRCSDGDDLARLVRGHPRVLGVVCGHVHRSARVAWAGTIGASARRSPGRSRSTCRPGRRRTWCRRARRSSCTSSTRTSGSSATRSTWPKRLRAVFRRKRPGLGSRQRTGIIDGQNPRRHGGLRLLQHPQVRRRRPAVRSGAGGGGDRRDRRGRDRAAGGGPAVRRPGRAARPRGARAARRAGAGAGDQPRTAATAGTATWCWCARGRCGACGRSRCRASSRAGRWWPTSTWPRGRCGWWRRTSGCFRQSRLMQVEALLEHAGETTDRPVVLMGDMNEWRLRRRSALHRLRAGVRAARRRRAELSRLFPGAGARPGAGAAARR